MSIICVYHSADIDGRVSAGIVKQKYPNEAVDFVPSNYGLTTNLNLDKDTTVIIVDFSFDLPTMKDIKERAKELIWIDHHPIINQHKEAGFDTAGLRDTAESAAYYCWKYFFPEREVPNYVKFTSDYDTWKHQLPESMAFNAAMYNEPMFNINTYNWSRLEDPIYIKELLTNGNRILNFAKLKNEVVRPHIFDTEIAGHKAVAINMRNTNSTVFNDCGHEGYKVMITFGKYNNMDTPRVTIYAKDNSVDVGKIAESFGGGGHPGAAGFTVPWDLLPLCSKQETTINYYLKPIMEVIDNDEYLREFYFKENSRVYKSLGSQTVFMGHTITMINHPLWAPMRSNYYTASDAIAWSFISGQYLYRAYINDTSFRDELKNRYNGTVMVDGSVWFLNDTLLFDM